LICPCLAVSIGQVAVLEVNSTKFQTDTLPHYSTIRSFGFPSLRGGASVEDVSPNTSLVLAIVGRGFFFNLAGRDLGQRGAFGL
jgi:hypothetical protein